MANRVPSWANYRQADISAESCATCIFMLDDGDCSRFDGHPSVKRTYTCDEWLDVNQVGKDHLDIDVDVDEQNPDPKYRAEPEHTAMESAFDRELWWDAMEGLEPTFRGVHAGPRNADMRKSEDVGLVSLRLTEIAKAQAMRATLTLRVGRIHTHPDGQRSYGMFSREGRYVGRTQPTNKRAVKGDTLSLDAAHFTLDPQGDSFWVSPVVTGQSPDAPHSWRELEALAGVPQGGLKGEVEMDAGPAADLVPGEDTNNSYSAPGPAGDIPLPGDDYNAQDQINQSFEGVEYDPVKSEIDKDGPTLSQVHVNAPMENISVSYAATAKRNKMLTLLPVRKADIPKQIVYGVVLEPNVLDTQQDFMRAEEIEKTAHGYLKKAIRGKSSVARLQHGKQGFFKNKPGLVPVESFIAPCDFTYDGGEMVTKGTWVLALHVEDPKVWNQVVDGTFTGFSIGGSGIRQEMNLPSDVYYDGHQWFGDTQPSDWMPQPTYTG